MVWCGVVWCALMCVSLAVRVCSGAGSGVGVGALLLRSRKFATSNSTLPFLRLVLPPFGFTCFSEHTERLAVVLLVPVSAA